MAQQDRIRLIRDLEKLRGSRVIAYVTSDRPPPFEAQMAMDVVRPFYAHLSALGHCSKVDVFLFSVGGDTMVPWRLANLIREYCDSFGVLIPYKAHSAATMLALGANEIVMGPLGELSPIDSSVQTPFNPPNSDQPNEPKTPISVEDVMGFFNLARERIGIADQNNLITALGHLAAKVHPLAIGSIYRSHALTRLLAAKLLELHYTGEVEKRAITRIVDELAEKLYYHNYTISRAEAKGMGIPMMSPTPEVEKTMFRLYEHYEQEMKLGQPFDPTPLATGGETSLPVAMLESSNLAHAVGKRATVQPPPPGQPPVLRVTPGQWTAVSLQSKEM